MDTLGPGMPPRNPAEQARQQALQARRAYMREHLAAQGLSLAMGLLECLRIAGVVLLVLDIAGMLPWPIWLAILLCLAPHMPGLVMLGAALAFSKLRRGRQRPEG